MTLSTLTVIQGYKLHVLKDAWSGYKVVCHVMCATKNAFANMRSCRVLPNATEWSKTSVTSDRFIQYKTDMKVSNEIKQKSRGNILV